MAQPWYDGPIWQGFKWTPQDPAAHSGIDIGMDIGTPLTALLPGYVISLGMEPWGGQINIQSEWPSLGQIVISYLHCSRFPLGIKAGSQVKPGQIIAYSGEPPSPQYGHGAHCHFEVSRGTQPPYMGHTGPSNPVDGTFLLDAAKKGTLGNVNANGVLAAASSASAVSQQVAIEPFGPAMGEVCAGLQFAGAFTAVPQIDWSLPLSNLGPSLGAAAHVWWKNLGAVLFRGLIVFVGLAIIALCLVNIIRGAAGGLVNVQVQPPGQPAQLDNAPPISPGVVNANTPGATGAGSATP